MNEKISRRDFLKYTGTSALALGVLPLFDRVALAPYLSGAQGEQVGMLIDTTKCIGCRACQIACQKKNNLPAETETFPANQTFPKELSASTFSLVEFRRVDGTEQTRTVKKQCMHCLEPACVSVCPVAAMEKTARGPVVYNAEKCIGCRYCMLACPFNVPKFEWDSANPRIRKCQMCADLTAQGKLPACVEACPTQAVIYGTRQELIAEAQARVAKEPDKYIPYIYGLSEVAGTSVLYLASVPFDQLGFNVDLPHTPLPDNTRQVLEKIPAIAAGIGLFLGGAAWWNGRRAKKEQPGGQHEQEHEHAE